MTTIRELRRRHRDFYLKLAEDLMTPVTAATLGWGPRPPDARERAAAAKAELDNVRSAIAWSLEVGDSDEACRLSLAAMPVWSDNHMLMEGRRWLDACIGAAPKPSLEILAASLHAYALLCHEALHYGAAIHAGERSAQHERALGNRERELIVRDRIAWAHFYDSRPAAARSIWESIIAGDTRNARIEAGARCGLGWTLLGSDNDRALREHDQALHLLEDDPQELLALLPGLVILRSNLGRTDDALRLSERGARLARELDDPESRITLLVDVARVRLTRGEIEAAKKPLVEALSVARAEGEVVHVPEVLRFMAQAAAHEGSAVEARLLATEALDLLRARPDLDHDETVHMDALLTQLGDLCVAEGDLAGAQTRAEERVEATRRVGRRLVREPAALYNLATIDERRGDVATAEAVLEQAVERARPIDDPLFDGLKSQVEAYLLFLRGTAGPARAAAARAVELNRRVGQPCWPALLLGGRIALFINDHMSALKAFEDAAQEAGISGTMRAMALAWGAHAALRGRDLDKARACLATAVHELEHRHLVLEIDVAEALSGLAEATGDEPLARRLLVSTGSVRTGLGLSVPLEDASWITDLKLRLGLSEGRDAPAPDIAITDLITEARAALLS